MAKQMLTILILPDVREALELLREREGRTLSDLSHRLLRGALSQKGFEITDSPAGRQSPRQERKLKAA